MVTTCNRWGVRGKAILTAIDEPVIVLLKSLRSISFPLEADCSNTFWAAICVVMKGDFLEGSNCLVKQFLEIVEIRQQKKKDIWKKNCWQTLTWASFTSPGRFETIIFSDPWATTLAVSVAGVAAAARARWAGVTGDFPRTWTRAEGRRRLAFELDLESVMICEVFSETKDYA